MIIRKVIEKDRGVFVGRADGESIEVSILFDASGHWRGKAVCLDLPPMDAATYRQFWIAFMEMGDDLFKDLLEERGFAEGFGEGFDEIL